MMDFSDKRVFITGGTGFIGTHLSKKLCSLGANVLSLQHVRGVKHGTPLIGDITRIDEDFVKSVKDFSPEIVFHLAAQSLVSVAMKDVCETVDANTKGSADLLCLCKDVSSLKSLVFVSTDKIFGNVSPITKDTVPHGVEHPYNASKLAADALAQMYSKFLNIPTVVVRNANVYGAGDSNLDRVVPRTITNVLRDVAPVVRGDGSNTRDYIHVSDLVDGYLRSAELPYTAPFSAINLSGFNHSVIGIVDMILEKLNRVDLAPIYEKQWRGEIPHQHIENDAAKELIGWNPTIDVSRGLDLTIPYYLENYGKN